MQLLQLQYMKNGKNQGGLYVNTDHVSAIRSERKNSLEGTFKTKLLLSNGVEYELANELNDVLEMMFEIEREQK